jgi:hypothetical protein
VVILGRKNRFQFSIAVMLVGITLVGLGLGIYRYLFPSPVYGINVHGSSLRRYHFYALGDSFELDISSEMVSTAQRWDRHKSNPPIAAGDALILADKVLLRWIMEKQLRKSHHGDWGFESLELVAMRHDEWYWLAKFDLDIDQSGPPHEFFVAVLMDGTIVEPIKMPPELHHD